MIDGVTPGARCVVLVFWGSRCRRVNEACAATSCRATVGHLGTCLAPLSSFALLRLILVCAS